MQINQVSIPQTFSYHDHRLLSEKRPNMYRLPLYTVLPFSFSRSLLRENIVSVSVFLLGEDTTVVIR